MSDTIVVALVGLASAVITALISAKVTSNNVTKQLEVSQAVTDTKIEELTREVREHNNFAKRMPVVENEISHIKDDINRYHQQ